MFKKHEPTYHKVVFIYTLVYAIYALFGRYTLLHGLVEHTINSFMYNSIAVIGLILLFMDFAFYHNYRKMRYYPVYILFIFCALISSLLNAKYGIKANLSTICWLLIQMGLFTTMGQLLTKERFDRWLTLFFSISGIMWASASIISLYQFVFVDGYTVFMNNRDLRQSFYDNRLFGVFIDPNLGAFVGLLVCFGMIYLIRKFSSKIIRTLCIANIVIQVIYIILSGSRSTEICFVVAISYTLIYVLKKRLMKKHPHMVIQILIGVTIPFVTLAVTHVSFNLCRSTATEITQTISPEHHTDKDELVRKDIEGNETNNRTDIWKSYLELMLDHPVFGLSPRNAWNYADTEHPDSYLSRHHYDVHNAYVAVLACMGIVGFLVLLLELFCFLRTLLPRMLSVEEMNPQYFVALHIIISIAVFICFYPGIYFTNGIDTILFWIAIGFTCKEAKPLKKVSE